jgi:hypothetical protein
MAFFRLEALTDAYDLTMIYNQMCLFHMEAVVAVLVAMVALMIMLASAMEVMILTVSTYIIHRWILLGLMYVHNLEDRFSDLVRIFDEDLISHMVVAFG